MNSVQIVKNGRPVNSELPVMEDVQGALEHPENKGKSKAYDPAARAER